ncbi:MAG: hypothetical protein ACREX8_09720 [Gammaproteobacteria bacterium]
MPDERTGRSPLGRLCSPVLVGRERELGLLLDAASTAQPAYTGGITTVGGPGHANPGAVLASCPVDFQAAGSAYNPTSDTLWTVGDANPYTEQETGYWIHQVDRKPACGCPSSTTTVAGPPQWTWTPRATC